jgi:beta-N-acetylhexosaminidase
LFTTANLLSLESTLAFLVTIKRKISLVMPILLLVSCAKIQQLNHEDSSLRNDIAQKIMLDLRYFCPESSAKADEKCTQSVTSLPRELSEMISEVGIGGVVLFANNLQDTEQMLRLNYSLQHAAQLGQHPPLFIAIDQEGGRVVRLPQNLGTAFAGNMAIGATYAAHGTEFADKSGAIIANELLSLGFNLNFAPTVDVNINPQNPVINVRSFGENPQMVAELGAAQLAAMQKQGLIATLKHFPGHGDTNVDSHTGLPRVNHAAEQISVVDLLPFQYAIDNVSPAMIMTAHIQYPQLDNTEFVANDGRRTVVPATMSRKILTELLRQKMGFKGVIVTDALEMAGIAHYFSATEAVIQTFYAGADIALMPIPIRYPQDIAKLKSLIEDVAKAVKEGRLQRSEISASAERIGRAKNQYKLDEQLSLPLDEAISQATTQLHNAAHHKVEQALANNAVVLVKNHNTLPLSKDIKQMYLSMPDTSKCMAMTSALKIRMAQINIYCDSTAKIASLDLSHIKQADVVIAADITPDQSLAELGGMDDISNWQQRAPKEQQVSQQLNVLQSASSLGKPTVFIALRAPYNARDFAPWADVILASFAYNMNQVEYTDEQGRLITQYQGAIYHALADILLGNIKATGQLPVSIDLVVEREE